MGLGSMLCFHLHFVLIIILTPFFSVCHRPLFAFGKHVVKRKGRELRAR
jgi:hypothetical protein